MTSRSPTVQLIDCEDESINLFSPADSEIAL